MYYNVLTELMYKIRRYINIKRSDQGSVCQYCGVLIKESRKHYCCKHCKNRVKVVELKHLYPKHSIKNLYKDYSFKEISSKLGISRKNLSILFRHYKIKRRDKKKRIKTKEGKIITKSGYILVYQPNHPKGPYVPEHRVVVERHLQRYLHSSEVVHHIDLDKKNNDISNLFVCNHVTHMESHYSMELLVAELYKKGLVKFVDGKYLLYNKGYSPK